LAPAPAHAGKIFEIWPPRQPNPQSFEIRPTRPPTPARFLRFGPRARPRPQDFRDFANAPARARKNFHFLNCFLKLSTERLVQVTGKEFQNIFFQIFSGKELQS
jgi:hypothetical protein